MSVAHGPLVVLHEHLDGGVRPATVLELAHRTGVATPTDDVAGLAEWLKISPRMPTEEAFSRFDLVIAATQTHSALRQVAREAVEDFAADGVIYAELRFAPLNHLSGGLTPEEVMAAVHAGIDDASSLGCDTRLIVCAMRNMPEAVSCDAAELAVRWMGERVVGLDLAGPEVGHPAAGHARAYEIAADAGLARTVHAGELAGVHQVRSALDHCNPDRMGHGWRLIDDCTVVDNRIVSMGPTATAVRDAGLPLEFCLTSNECFGTPLADHPVRLMFDAGFKITLSPGNRTLASTTARRELERAASAHGFSDIELAACVEQAAVAAFLPDADRDALVTAVANGWPSRPARLVHLAERHIWEAVRGQDSYLPSEWNRDGFIHLSSLYQVLTPATRFYRGRTDLVALVIDAQMLGPALVWEAGTGTVERFPHLYSALSPEAVVAEIALSPEPDGGFFLPPELRRSVGQTSTPSASSGSLPNSRNSAP